MHFNSPHGFLALYPQVVSSLSNTQGRLNEVQPPLPKNITGIQKILLEFFIGVDLKGTLA